MRLSTDLHRLLASSFIYVVGRAIALPYLAIFVTQKYALNQQQLGWLLGGSLSFATIFGLYAGYLSDRINKTRLLRWACYLMAVSSVLISLGWHLLLTLLCLIVIEVAIVTRSIALKSALAELTEEQQRGKIFSINYTLINLAFSLGPLLGALVFRLDNLAPFWLAAAVALLASSLIPAGLQRGGTTQNSAKLSLRENWGVLRSDKRLLWFTLGSICSAFVFGRFISGYLAQYLLTKGGVDYAASVIPVIFITNALTVVVTQYVIGKNLRQSRLFAWVCLGLGFYIAGLFGFVHAQSSMSWVVATLIFTLGEVIVIPCEYLFIDSIAPAELRGSYYGVQGLASLGLAVNPILCGYLLAHFSASLMFYVLMAFALCAIVCFYIGTRLQQNRVEAGRQWLSA